MIPLLVLIVVLITLGAFWVAKRRPSGGGQDQALMTIGEEGVRARALELRDQLDRAPFGESLARAAWAALMTSKEGEGLIREFHRDFCGHGLIRTPDGVKLCDVNDGGYLTGAAIAEWRTEQDFISFFARQSDFSCSGWDAAEPVFATDDEWYRNNQRLTRESFERFVKTGSR